MGKIWNTENWKVYK